MGADRRIDVAPSNLNSLTIEDVTRAMRRDQFRLRRWLKKIETFQQRGDDRSRDRQHWQDKLRASIELRKLRASRFPPIKLDEQLPIAARADDLRRAIADQQVVVVSGETGSGKSTQLPLLCLQLGLGQSGFIGHTQPRRIAARSIASRIAEHLSTSIGDLVGYKIRFGDQTQPHTLVKLMTDGMLLAETLRDPFLDHYEVIIVDEAHERSLNIDFLLGYLKRLLPRRPDLKIIITSATIDTKRFAEHMSLDPARPAPVLEVEGRNYPVDILYQPPHLDGQGNPVDRDLEESIVDAVLTVAGQDRGDVLVFLPTEQDIRSLSNKLRARSFPGDGANRTEVLPLYARLSTEQQNLIFHPGPARRVVLATNVAESSITVPRIRYVIDTGTARISRYAPRSKVQRLPIEPISQASAQQRAGRCGRVGPGICLRLYSEDDYLSRAKFTTPEIRRTNLASVILQTEALKLGAIAQFPFIDAPRQDAIRDGYRTLFEIGAVDEAQGLTPLGKQLSRLPVDPRIGRMLYAAADHRCLVEVLVIAAALEIQDPRVRPADKQAAADQQHAKFRHSESDFMGLLDLWDFIHEQRQQMSRNQFRKSCSKHFLSYPLIRQWIDIYRQLKSLMVDERMHISSGRDNYAAIHSSLLAGLLSGVALRSGEREYTGAGGVKFTIWPGSGLAKTKTSWILAGEIVETARRYGRMVARIDPAWIEPLAEHLVKRSYSDPHWSKKRQSATAFERLTLFGLPIVSRRPVRYGAIDPDHARELLIAEGLAEDQMRVAPPFLVHNRQVLEQARSLADKTRRRDLIIENQQLRAFYEQRLPPDIVDGATLTARLKRDSNLDQRLRFELDELLAGQKTPVDQADYPDEIQLGELTLPLQYKFQPGNPDDGVTLQVPVEGVTQLHAEQLGWFIPGLLEARITALIRSLPKSLRRQLVPAPDTAKVVASRIEFGRGSFLTVVADELSRIAEQPISIEMFDQSKLDDHLRLNVQACDAGGKVIAQARSLPELQSQLPGDAILPAIKDAPHTPWHQDHLQDWSWGNLPESIVADRGIAQVPLYPTIVDAGDSVQLRLLDNRELSNAFTRRGLSTLFCLVLKRLVRSQVNWLPELDRLTLIARLLPNQANGKLGPVELKQQLGHLIARLALVENQPPVRCRNEFERRCQGAVQALGVAAQTVAPWLVKFLETFQQCSLQLEELGNRAPHLRQDIERQFSHLFRADFLLDTPWRWLEHYPRYLTAVLMRLDRAQSGGMEKDKLQTDNIEQYWRRYVESREASGRRATGNDALETYAWMVQEFRVSVFAQQLGTSLTVSEKRLEKQWSEVAKGFSIT